MDCMFATEKKDKIKSHINSTNYNWFVSVIVVYSYIFKRFFVGEFDGWFDVKPQNLPVILTVYH